MISMVSINSTQAIQRKTAAIYARYSPGRDRDQSSTIEAQIAMCREKAQAEGVRIEENHIYIDRSISGASIQREAFQRLLANIEAGNFPDILYVKDDKRLFRNEREAGELIEWIWTQNIEIHYCLIRFGDPRASDEEWFLQRSFHLFAELERRRKTREVFEHQRQNALAGFSNGGLPPYGYRRKELEIIDKAGVKKKKLTWEIDSHESEAVRIAYEMQLGGIGIKTIAHTLTRQGFRSRRGGVMNKLTVAEWFRNPYPHAGCVVWNTRDTKLRPKPRSEWVIVKNAYPGIISLDIAEKIYEKSQARKRGEMPKKRGDYLLSGLMKCGVCGAAYIMNSTPKRGDAFYVCGTRQRKKDSCDNKLMLHRDEVEKQITDWLKTSILTPDFLEPYFARVIDAVQALIAKREDSAVEIAQKIQQADQRIKRLVDALADGHLPGDVIREKIYDEQRQKRDLESQRSALDIHAISFPDIETFQHEMSDALDTPETQKVALRSLVKQITVHPNATLDIECNIVQTCFQEIALHPIEHKTGFRSQIHFVPPPRGGYRPRLY